MDLSSLILVITGCFCYTEQAFDYYIDAHDNCDNVYGALQSPDNSTEWVTYLGIFDSTQECINACLNNSVSDDNRCGSYTYYTSSVTSAYSKHCYGRFGVYPLRPSHSEALVGGREKLGPAACIDVEIP